jgi:hypothetical protein
MVNRLALPALTLISEHLAVLLQIIIPCRFPATNSSILLPFLARLRQFEERPFINGIYWYRLVQGDAPS